MKNKDIKVGDVVFDDFYSDGSAFMFVVTDIGLPNDKCSTIIIDHEDKAEVMIGDLNNLRTRFIADYCEIIGCINYGPNNKQCTCSIHDLMIQGCNCGGV